LNLIPGYWVPAFIYSEEAIQRGAKNQLGVQAQTRIWGYDLKRDGQSDELTHIRVDSVQDEAPAPRTRRPWRPSVMQQQAEDNVVGAYSAPVCWLPQATSIRFSKRS